MQFENIRKISFLMMQSLFKNFDLMPDKPRR